VGSEKASEIAGNATFTEKSSGAIEAPNPMMTNAMMFKRRVAIKKYSVSLNTNTIEQSLPVAVLVTAI
jgi:hypothetical protein